jgi:prepilin-type N-terminal cleavage/methylation domain-containing protein
MAGFPRKAAYIFPHCCMGGCKKCVGIAGRHEGGFTFVELVITIVVFGVLIFLAMQAVAHYRQKAFDITLKYDLRNFRTSQETYVTGHGGDYLGDVGESIGSDGLPNDFVLPGFVASNGVRFIITSSPAPFIIQGSHLESSTIYEYDFTNDILTRNP